MIIISGLKVFISHASANKESADEICSYLEKNGKECWIAPRDIPAGAEYGEEIIKGIETSDVMVLVFSAAANNSQHVLREVERAVNRKIPIIAFKIEYCTVCRSMEYFLSSNQWLDASFNITEMLGPLNSSIEKIHEMNLKSEDNGAATPVTTINVTKKSAPIIAGIVGVSIIAIVIAVIALCDSITVNNNINVNQTETSAEDSVNFGQGNSPVASAVFEVGDYISLGRYYPTGYSEGNADADIVWQVVNVDENSGKVTLLSSKIIDVKPYDCAESGEYGIDLNGNKYDEQKISEYSEDELVSANGSAYWQTSDIRAWLNSSGSVEYYGTAPSDKATDQGVNSFGEQDGFLTSFTKEEMNLICETETEDMCQDLVYLPSLDEVNTYISNESFILHPAMTKSAEASDASSWCETYYINGNYHWVTRTPSTMYPHLITMVECSDAHQLFGEYDAASSWFGIRPAVTLDVNQASSLGLAGDGSEEEPYSFIF